MEFEMIEVTLSAIPVLSLITNVLLLGFAVGLTVFCYRHANPFMFVYLALASFAFAASIISTLGLVTDSTLLMLMSVGFFVALLAGGALFTIAVGGIYAFNKLGMMPGARRLMLYSNPAKGLKSLAGHN